MSMEDKIEKIEERFELSRASLMTQIFVSLATAHGAGMAAALAMIGQIKESPTLVIYLTIIVFVFGLGLFSIVTSAFYRFEHSKIAEKVKIAKIKKDTEELEKQSCARIPLLKKYRRLMYASLYCLLIAILIGMSGAIHSYFEKGCGTKISKYNKAVQLKSNHR